VAGWVRSSGGCDVRRGEGERGWSGGVGRGSAD